MSRYLNSPREADWYACPSCGDEVRVGSSGCRKCALFSEDDDINSPKHGSEEDSTSGDWSEDSEDGARRFLAWKYRIAGICLIVAMVWLAVFAGFMRH